MFIFFDVIKKEAFRVCQSLPITMYLVSKNTKPGDDRKSPKMTSTGSATFSFSVTIATVLPLCRDLLLSISIHILGVSVKLIFIFECLQRCKLMHVGRYGKEWRRCSHQYLHKAGMYVFHHSAAGMLRPSLSSLYHHHIFSFIFRSHKRHRPGHVSLIWHPKSPPPLTFVFGARQNLVGAWDQWCHSTLLGSPSSGARLRSR